MILSPNDYIEVGVGQLYSPPFLSRILIYRFFDYGQAVLIYHRETSNIAIDNHSKGATMIATEIPPTLVYVHCCFESADISLSNLLKQQAVEIPMPTKLPVVEKFKNLSIRLEQFALKFTEKIIVTDKKEQQQMLFLGNSDYRVTGPVRILTTPEIIKSSNVKLNCIKASVTNINSETVSKAQSDFNWELTAVDMKHDQVLAEVALHKGGSLNK